MAEAMCAAPGNWRSMLESLLFRFTTLSSASVMGWQISCAAPAMELSIKPLVLSLLRRGPREARDLGG